MRIRLFRLRMVAGPLVGLGVVLGATSPIYAEPPSAPSADQRAAAASSLQKKFQDLSASYQKLPRDTFDPAAVIEQVGRDPDNLLKWVREQTSWVPYRGCLRGASGVLMDRVGNSLDRSVLLCDLLKSAGFSVRLARADLSEEQARQLLDVVAVPVRGEAPTDVSPVTAEARKRVLAQAASVEGLVGALPGAADQQADGLAAAREHWWVQRQSAGAWVDLDPTLPAAPGNRPAAAETFPFDGRDGTIRLPSHFMHEVGIKIVVEVWAEGRLSDHTALEANVRPAEFLAGRVSLRHFPLNVPSAPPATDDHATKAALLAEHEWLPVLVFGARHVARRSFTDAGELNEKPNLDPTAKLAKATGSAFGGLGGGLSGNAGTAETKKSVLTAEWLEYEIRTPGRPPRSIRREVFDHLGPAARAAARTGGIATAPVIDDAKRLERALVLAGTTQSLLLACQPSPEFQLHMMAQDLLDRRDLWLRMASESDPTKRGALAGAVEPSGPLPYLAFARQTLSPAPAQTYLDQVNILNYRVHLRPTPEGKFADHHTIDVVANDVAVRGQAGTQGFATRLRQGVADTAAEDLILGGDAGTDNTSRLVEAAKAQNINLILVRDANEAAVKSLDVPGDARSRVLDDLARGFAVVLPVRPVTLAEAGRFGWWRIDPRTGDTIGVMDSGFHSATTEKGVLEDTQVGRTVVRYRPGRVSSFWIRHPAQIAQEAGFPGNFNEVVSLICDIQNDLRLLGML